MFTLWPPSGGAMKILQTVSLFSRVSVSIIIYLLTLILSFDSDHIGFFHKACLLFDVMIISTIKKWWVDKAKKVPTLSKNLISYIDIQQKQRKGKLKILVMMTPKNWRIWYQYIKVGFDLSIKKRKEKEEMVSKTSCTIVNEI